jgi:hypothetical protein
MTNYRHTQYKKYKMQNIYDIIKDYTMIDYERIKSLANAIDVIKNQNIDGDIIECGSWRCGTLGFASLYSKSINLKRKIRGFDSFEGLPTPNEIDGDSSKIWSGKLAVTIEEGYQNLKSMGAEDVFLYKGFFEQTLKTNKAEINSISILRIDCDWYSSTKTCLDELYDLVNPGGFIIIDDYGHWQGCRQAVDEFRKNKNLKQDLIKTDYTEYWWRK